ncbi:MAG: glycine betaine/proline transport system ATP-binding protein [Candidatus Magnetoglobus multicellularis str. Araruama]|uniref:Glycine betaine/proline transport system ATP-binding protein n=1 Tax=Candidatus Magnetoglobus multicellularis str. Araruama TaxID=890399 RepID=A0A1V1P1F5_9BACT|nr:MAG: glycine betaine/proline transport system ATP-binding protein [Candidatus Magnetoglobus multicellularis str. Araruama]
MRFCQKTGQAVGVGDISFTVEEGEILVIMGLSGSGKSTLIRCVNRLIEPTQGKVFVDDLEVLSLNNEGLRECRRTKFGMVFQNFALFPHRTVLRNVEFGLEIRQSEAEMQRNRALNALELVGLSGWENNYPDELSGGMQQRVGLARALALDPDILLMDEAFSALDPLIRREMQDELIALQQSLGKTILFITHDLDEALKLGDRIILLKDGRKVQEGTGEEILTQPATRYVEKFVEDVDKTKVITAQTVMRKPRVVAYYTDGPRVSLRKMDEENISSLFVLNKNHELRGVVHAEDAAKAIERGEKNLENIINTDIQKVSPDTSVQEFIGELANIRIPVAVVNDNGNLLGIIVRGSLIAELAR